MITATSPRWLPVVADAIPRELRDITAWYPAIIRPTAGKVGKWDKRPGNPETGTNTKWSDPTTRCTFRDTFTAYESQPGVVRRHRLHDARRRRRHRHRPGQVRRT
jgi:hypothetical protein